MKLNEESSDFVYLGKRIDKTLNYIQNNKTDLLGWFKQYVESPYLNMISGELEIEEEDYIFDYLDSLVDDLEIKYNTILENKKIMTNEQLRMQMLSGVITEGQYKAKLEENKKPKSKKSLKEGMIGGIVGIGAINQIPPRAKTDYETAFEHFLGARYELKEEMGEEMEKEELIEKIKNLGDFGFTGDEIEVKGLLITASTQEDEGGPYYFVYGEDDDSEDGIFQSTNPNEIAEFVLNY